ncbi:MAG: cellulase family glycosylhydrolase [Candidatus Azobacteroides sp.]|nr:cellulase family glycosylhydrolase [Candidatus Azobacteroides sp.]
MKRLIIACSIALILPACNNKKPSTSTQGFVQVQNGRLAIDEKPYYFIGTNFWFGAILGSEGQGGNRERLTKELDFMKSIGINNLRVLIGADGYPGQEVKVMPTLQLEPGVYNDTIFDGLDYLMAELGKRSMYAVLYINNSWEWSGGYGQYLNWAGKGEVPKEGVRDWIKFQAHVAQYANCDECKILFFNHIKHILGRTNPYTGLKYTDDPVLMSWQVGNEPRAFSTEAKDAFAQWLAETTALIRSLDAKHLISLGNEGAMGCENDLELYERIHADLNVDYITIHIWPKNWSWIDTANIPGSLGIAIEKTNAYLNAHLEIAKKLNKPLVIEEFGFPRDHHLYSRSDPSKARDQYYENIFRQVVASSDHKGLLAGCNFWAWGGFGQPAHTYWKPWDDYVGDPSQEEQGLNSVFDTDSTIETIRTFTAELK